MIGKLDKMMKRLRERQRTMRELSPKAFEQLAAEVRQLAEVAGRLRAGEDAQQAKLARIQADVDKVFELTTTPEFMRLPAEQRQKLREGLLNSRNELMDAVQSAPSPTDRLQ